MSTGTGKRNCSRSNGQKICSCKTGACPETGTTDFCKKAEDQNGTKNKNQVRHICGKSLAKQSVGGCSQAGRNCHPQRAVASGYGDQNGEGSKRGRKEGPAGNRGSGRKAGRSYRRGRRGCCFRRCGDLARWDAVRFAAWNPVRRRGHRHGDQDSGRGCDAERRVHRRDLPHYGGSSIR